MALQLRPFLNRNGFFIEEAYFIITEVAYDIKNKIFSFNGELYLNKEAYENGFYPIDYIDETFSIEDKPNYDYIQFAYDKIKSIIDNNTEEYITTNLFKYKGFIGYKEVD